MKKPILNKLIKATFVIMILASNLYARASECDVYLQQKDFDAGTYIIKKSGIYCLKENISFNPNSVTYLNHKLADSPITAYEASMPLRSQLGCGPGQYNPAAFGLGFFAAIAVVAPNVIIDLKGKTLEQSEEHALMQRFFSVIETSDRPFISGQGPADFGTIVGAAENLVIKNGKIGRSSHHGIHGNRAKKITIENIQFKDFEVAAVALNGVDGLILKNLKATSRQDVPVLGQFSSAQFIKAYVNYLVRIQSTTTINGLSALQIQAALKVAINNVYDDLIIQKKKSIQKNQHPKEWALFHNEYGVNDGNSYGFLINGVGVAVNGFPFTTSTKSPSKNVVINNVKVEKLKANIKEIVTVAAHGNAAVAVNDPVGSTFQLLALAPDGRPIAMTSASGEGIYIGNVVTNAQALVAKAVLNGDFPPFVDTSRNSISQELITWVESGTPLTNYLELNPGPHGTGFICNGDQMFHVNKGVIGFKLDGAIGVDVRNSQAKNISNIGKAGSSICGSYERSHPAATLKGYGGAITRGVSIAGSQDVSLTDIEINKVSSKNGSAIGVDIQTDSKNVEIKDVKIQRLSAGSTYQGPPTAHPEAIAIRTADTASDVVIEHVVQKKLKAYDDVEIIIQDLNQSATIGYPFDFCSN